MAAIGTKSKNKNLLHECFSHPFCNGTAPGALQCGGCGFLIGTFRLDVTLVEFPTHSASRRRRPKTKNIDILRRFWFLRQDDSRTDAFFLSFFSYTRRIARAMKVFRTTVARASKENKEIFHLSLNTGAYVVAQAHKQSGSWNHRTISIRPLVAKTQT